MRFNHSSFSKPHYETKEYKKQQKELKIKEEKENLERFLNIFYTESSKEQKMNNIVFKENGIPEYFKELEFKTNKIHIFRGNNGQGKSSLLKSIVKTTSFNQFDQYTGKLKYGSNNYNIAHLLNENLEHSSFKFSSKQIETNEFLQVKNFDNTLSTAVNNITLYTDFSIDYFQNKTDLFSEVMEVANSYSNGERKIVGINKIFRFLKTLLLLEPTKIEGGLNIIVCMDEPESGLSVELQEEFSNKIKFYLNKITKKYSNISCTFFIVSHSFVWEKSKDIEIHKINDLKKEQTKKEHKKIFV
jgi:predicted ATPase